MIATTIDYQKFTIGAQNVYIAISDCRSLSQSPRVSFFKLGVVGKPKGSVAMSQK